MENTADVIHGKTWRNRTGGNEQCDAVGYRVRGVFTSRGIEVIGEKVSAFEQEVQASESFIFSSAY